MDDLLSEISEQNDQASIVNQQFIQQGDDS